MYSYESGPVPLAAKQHLIRFYLQKNRSLEETQLLQGEMFNTRVFLDEGGYNKTESAGVFTGKAD